MTTSASAYWELLRETASQDSDVATVAVASSALSKVYALERTLSAEWESETTDQGRIAVNARHAPALGPYAKAGKDAFARYELSRGRRLVRVKSSDGPGNRPPMMTPITTWRDYAKVRDQHDSIVAEHDAEIYHGWRWFARPTVASGTHDDRVKLQADDLRVQAEAKRLVASEMNPVEALSLKSVADLLNAPAPEWWVNRVLPKDAIVIVGGDGGVGKSALLVELTARLSTGTPFLGQFAARRASVLYAVGEGMSGYGPRFEAVGRAHGLDADQVTLVDRGVSLTSTASIAQITALVKESKVDVVVFDTLSSLSTLESENDAAEVGRLIGNAKKVREANPGCTVIVVHHTNKASGGLRGSSVIRDNADVVWMLRGDPDAFFMSTKAKHGGKVKDGDPLEIHGLSLVPSGRSIVLESAQGPMESGSSAAKRARGVAEQLTDERVYSTGEMREIIRAVDTGASETTIKRTLTELVSDAVLVSEARGQYRAAKVHPAGGPMAPSA